MTERHARASGRMASAELAQIRRDQKADGRKRAITKYTVVHGVDPLVREFFAEAERQRANMTELGRKTGSPRETFYKWQTGVGPGLAIFVAAVEALGGKVEITWPDAPNGHALLGKGGPMQPSPLTQTASGVSVEASAIGPHSLPESSK